MVDAKAAVDLASGWTNAPELREITSESATINLAIPDAPSSGSARTVSTSLTIDPYVEFIEFVEINTNFSHTNFRDLTVELVSPSGAVSTLSNSAPIGGELTTEFRFGSARHLGENAAGEWTLRVKDVLRRDSGTLKSWGLTIYGHGSIPGAPDIDAVTPGGGTLTIDWKEPTVTGATAITSYDLRYIREDATDKSDDNWILLTDVGTPGNLSHTITGLEGGVKYEFQIRAHNDSGHGPWSKVDGEEPTTVTPSAPSITSITRGDRTLAVVWTAPSDTGRRTHHCLRRPLHRDQRRRDGGRPTGRSGTTPGEAATCVMSLGISQTAPSTTCRYAPSIPPETANGRTRRRECHCRTTYQLPCSGSRPRWGSKKTRGVWC